MKIKILNKKWTVRFFGNKKWVKKFGKGFDGLTKFHKRAIYIRNRGDVKETTIHELIHAYLYEYGMWAADMISKDAFEEVVAEMFSKHGDDILNLARKIQKNVKKERF